MPKKKAELTFEAAMQSLESTVQKLEGEQLTLEESLTLFEAGIKLSRHCSTALDEAQLRVSKLTEDGKTIEAFKITPEA